MNTLKLTFACAAFFLMQFSCFATQKTAVANTNWSAASTWSNNQLPQDNDTLTIPAGMTVTVDIVTDTYVNMRIIVNGTLYFESGQKIRLDCNGSVHVSTGGQLVGESPGSKIEICNEYVWDGNDPGTGPLDLFASSSNASGTTVGRQATTPVKPAFAGEMKLYPNPAASAEEVKMDVPESLAGKEILVVVMDAMGREIYSKILLTGTSGSSFTGIDPSTKLSSGLYYVTASSANAVFQQKLVIQ